jgi:hypothetical protein
MEQKLAAIRYFTNRVQTYNLDPKAKQKEINTLNQVIHSNHYNVAVIDRLKVKKHKQKQVDPKPKWAEFTYTGRETLFITRLFKNTNLRVAFTTNNNLGKILNTQGTKKTNKFDMNGVYQLTCQTSQMKCIGQTERVFHVRFSEHYRDYKYANNKSKFAQHFLEEGHSFGPMTDVMDLLQVAKKGKMLDTLERFYIYREMWLANPINDNLMVKSNPIYEALTNNTPNRRW